MGTAVVTTRGTSKLRRVTFSCVGSDLFSSAKAVSALFVGQSGVVYVTESLLSHCSSSIGSVIVVSTDGTM
jgi:hypothetical protein